MAEPTERTIKKLFALSGNVCAYPGCKLPIIESAGTVTGEICHIKAKSVGGPRFDDGQSEKDRHDFDNLILLCRGHHKVVDADPDRYTVDALNKMKSDHEKTAGRSDMEEDRFSAKILINDFRRASVTNNSGNVAINSPGAVQAKMLTVKTTNKKITVSPPLGTIGSDQQASRYIQYLINRYNKFAAPELSRKTKFNYGAIPRNIENKFGSKWQLLSLEKAEAVFEYLQTRISKTRLAKINMAKGQRSFSSYQKFVAKYDS